MTSISGVDRELFVWRLRAPTTRLGALSGMGHRRARDIGDVVSAAG
ncbi:MAG: hypothetical protein ACYCSF_03805 [Acidimicrobiales bacterium]